MKLMRLAMCMAAFAMVGGIATAEDMDIKALQAKLAAQESRLNDLQAKMGAATCEDDTPKNIVSLRKNAKVTIGGQIDTRYFYRQGNIKTALGGNFAAAPADWDAANNGAAIKNAYDVSLPKTQTHKGGDLRVANVKLEFKMDVNEYFDAYIKLDVQDTHRRDVSGIAQNAWIRWKNLCNSGFGVLIGRDSLKFGPKAVGTVLDKWNQDDGPDSIGGIMSSPKAGADWGEGMFWGGNMKPGSFTYGHSRTTQISPYWENQDGTFKAELSLLQSVDRRVGNALEHNSANRDSSDFRSINYGLGSFSGRVNWKPMEGLDLFASVINVYARNGSDWAWNHVGNGTVMTGLAEHIRTASNNTAVNGGFMYTPCFFQRMTVWANYTYSWNDGWVDDLDSGIVNAGIKFKLNDQLAWFGSADYMHTKNSNAIIWNKAKGYDLYTGFQYNLPYGVDAELGYRYERMNYKDNNGFKHTKFRGHTAYAHLGFKF